MIELEIERTYNLLNLKLGGDKKMSLEEIRKEINELKEYRDVICKLMFEKSEYEKREEAKDKPKVKTLMVRRNERI